MTDHNRAAKRTVSGFFFTVLGLYAAGSFFPDSFPWGINHFAFLPLPLRVILLLIVLLIGLPFISRRYLGIVEFFQKRKPISGTMRVALYVVVGIAVIALCGSFRIVIDIYGDGINVAHYLLKGNMSLWGALTAASTEPLTIYTVQLIARVFQFGGRDAYVFTSCICGSVFVLAVLLFARSVEGPSWWKVCIAITLFATGASQLFFGYVENYTIAYVTAVLFCISAWLFFDGRKYALWAMLALFLLGTRFHIEMILFFPALLFAIASALRGRFPRVGPFLSAKRVSLAVGISLAAAIVAYFYYFEAYRYVTADRAELAKKIFLPLTTYLQPPHSYSLLTLNHVSDVLQEFLLTVSPLAVLLLALSIRFSGKIKGQWTQQNVFFGLAALYFLLFDFTVNPILSMPRDWDFLSLAAVPVMFFALSLSRRVFEQLLNPSVQKMITGVGIALGICSCTFIGINANETATRLRLQGVGRWVFKSYSENSGYILNVSAKMIPDLDEQIAERTEDITALLPYASRVDGQIGWLYYKLGFAQFQKREFMPAGGNFLHSIQHQSLNSAAAKMLATTALQCRMWNRGFEIISEYNKQINSSSIQDSEGVVLARYAWKLQQIIRSQQDTAQIQRALDQLYNWTVR